MIPSPDPAANARRSVALALLVAAGAGCATRRAPRVDATLVPRPSQALVVTRSGNRTTLTWHSDPGKVYTIVYKEGAGPQNPWKPLSGYEQLPGTGRQQSVTLTTPYNSRRLYNLQVRMGSPRR